MTSLNVKEDSNALKDLASVELARADENVVKKSKVALYLDRFNMRAQADISAASLENMSLFQFISRMDRHGSFVFALASTFSNGGRQPYPPRGSLGRDRVACVCAESDVPSVVEEKVR